VTFAFSGAEVPTNYYVDGFNLYYRALKHGPNRWLDLSALFNSIYPQHQMHRIRYFTSMVSGSSDPGAPIRQGLYLRALATTPSLTFHYGQFNRNPVRRPPVDPSIADPDGCVGVWDTKEKGSDVNLASMLLLDAHKDDFEAAIVVTNDSDLVLPVQLVASVFQKPVGILEPSKKRSESLYRVASSYRFLHRAELAASQFPATLTDASGTFSKPPTW